MCTQKTFNIMMSQVRSNIQEVGQANGPTNLNLIHHGLQDHHFHPSLYAIHNIFFLFSP